MSTYGLVEFSCCVSSADFGGAFTALEPSGVGNGRNGRNGRGPNLVPKPIGFSMRIMRSILLDPFSL